MHTVSQIEPKKKGVNKLVLGFAAVVASAVVATTGFAAAASVGNGNKPPTKEQCAAAGFKNYGQCVKEWALNKNHPGGGYNGNVHTSINLNLNNSNGNVFEIIVHNTINLFR